MSTDQIANAGTKHRGQEGKANGERADGESVPALFRVRLS
jgi:hypothetical protein